MRTGHHEPGARAPGAAGGHGRAGSQEAIAGSVYQAVPGFEDHLARELGRGADREPRGVYGQLYVSPRDESGVFWYQNCWQEPFRVTFDSISEAAAALRGIQRNWAPCLFTHFRRGSLIASKLPPISAKPRPFPRLLPEAPVGAWTLLDAHTMIASARCSSPFPGGRIEFEEDQFGPPSRAYLKLWEALLRLRSWPAAGERCLDAGASPGGWTWALARLGAAVIAVDRAPLEERVAALPGVEFLRHDAFTLQPEDLGPLDWLFCDVACYPPRLFDWIGKWLASGLCGNFVCTIKMQGGVDRVDFETPQRFSRLGGEVVHLYHNKHELTWMKAEHESRMIPRLRLT